MNTSEQTLRKIMLQLMRLSYADKMRLMVELERRLDEEQHARPTAPWHQQVIDPFEMPR